MSKRKPVTFDTPTARREITVGAWTFKEAAIREAIRKSNMAKSVIAYLGDDADEELANALSLYPFIAGCCLPIITIDEFLEIPETVVDEMSKAAMELNAHWFVAPDQEKKTNEQPTTYTSD